ncbi:UxaA family hydrolase [Acinetobacter baumannii]|uniref:UxaA family hydrolase n=1 Tax=Acinetobacter baumannii TaxID=470 RepID=UPI003B4394BE
MEKTTIKLNAKDDVIIAIEDIAQGTYLSEVKITTQNFIPAGHKIALSDKQINEPLLRYGQVIGFATQNIKPGEHVHTHNLGMGEFEKEYAWAEDFKITEFEKTTDYFMGIRRADGRAATRNYIGLISSVNCSATVIKAVEDHFKLKGLDDYPNVDGIVSLPQSFGCAIGNKTETMAVLRRTIVGYATHTNFAGVILVGLGCESNQIKDILECYNLNESGNLQTYNIQDVGGTRKAIEKGIEIVEQMLPVANKVTREKIPVSELILALECGGSDSYSGISANPILGYAADKIIAQGGTAILSETSEIYGAEHLLTRRAVNKEVGVKLIKRIEWWEDYCQRTGSEMNNNPSAGNKEGGLTTVLEKSLGGISKAGTTNLVEVYEYAEPVTAKGFVFMDTPGYDPLAVTGQIAGGANILCFTTGRGSAFGSKPTPCLKLCTNNKLWERQEEDMDINCGTVISGEETIADVGERLYRMILDMASGKKTKSEEFGYGSQEFVPWIVGSIM